MIARRVGSNATVRFFERSGHAMSIDVDKTEVYDLITAHFLAAAGRPEEALAQ